MRKLCRETVGARKDTPLNPFVKFVVFGVLGPVLIGVLYFSLMKPAVTIATRDLTSNMQRQSAAVMERAKAQQADAARRASDAQRAQLEARAAQTRSDMEAARLEQQQAARKDAAWQAFFKPKKVCDNPPDSDTQVECGNAYMRAKRDFDARWERGDLR
jgi:hypothetical protein